MGLFEFSGSSRQIAACIVASLPTFMAGMVLGWPSPVMQYMSDGRAPVLLTPKQTSWMIVCIDVGNFAMAVPAGWLMDRMGRKFIVNMSTPLMFTGWMFILFGRQAWCLYLARVLQGAAASIGFVVPPAYVGEMASTRIRGKLCLLVQLSYALGLLFSYVGGWLLDGYAALAVASACATVAFAVMLLRLPESPYYLMMDGRPVEAAECLWRLRSYTAEDLQSELVDVEKSLMDTRCKGTVKDLLNRDRRPFMITAVLSVLQMACGASVLEAYAGSVLAGSRVSETACAVILGIVIVAATVPFALTVDKFGRRPLMIISCFGTAACHAAVVVCLLRRTGNGDDWLPLFGSLAGVQFFINIGIMPLLGIVQCEYFPSDTRARADAAVLLIITATSTVMVTAYQLVAAAYGVAANFAIYAVLSLAGGVFCYAFMPETKGKTFVEIQTDFHRHDRLVTGRKARRGTDDGTADGGTGNGASKCDYQQV